MNSTQHHIIVPTDFSDQSKIALTQSYNLARFTGSIITLIHVIDEDLFSSMIHLFTDKEKQEELLRVGIQTNLDELAKEASINSGLNINTRIEKGKIYEQIVAVAEEFNATFIVMSTSGPTTLRKKFIGSNAERVIKDAHCPVISIKGKEHKAGCNTIVFPLDLSKETKEKVNKCIEIAQFFKSTVKVMTVTDTTDEFLINKLERQMEQVIDFISSHEIICTGEFVDSKDISDGVLNYAEKVKADLIIIMTQQELDWTLHFIGNESQQIINNSEIPVCSIRPIQRKDTLEFVI